MIRRKDHDQRHEYEEKLKERTGKKSEGKKGREEAKKRGKKALYDVVEYSYFDDVSTGTG